MNRRRILVLLALAAVLAVPATASAARTNVAVGIGDQNPSMFSDPSYKALNLRKTRYFIDWNAASKADELAAADRFVAAARAARVKVLMHISTDDLTARKAKLPSRRQYRAAVGALVKRYKPLGVTEWGVWNEVNHNTQPTWDNPRRAAQFYLDMRKLCRGCTIVALDVLDQQGVERYIARWLSAAGSAGRRATVFGIHNYSEVNRKLSRGTNRYPGTARVVRAFRKRNTRAKFWYTETGGLAQFASFKCDMRRQADRTKYMFTLAKRHRRDVTRLYSYNWTGADCAVRFDAGLVNVNGSRRPAYNTFKSQLKNFKR